MLIRVMPVVPVMLAFSALLVFPFCLRAQDTTKPFRYDWNSHVAFSIGTCWHRYALMGVAGGGEVFLWRGLSVGGDLSAQRFVAHGPVFGLLSMTVGYHFVNRHRPVKFDPFISNIIGGAFTNDFWVGTGGISGGLNYWFRDGMGLRAEARFQVADEEGLLMFRIGLSFR